MMGDSMWVSSSPKIRQFLVERIEDHKICHMIHDVHCIDDIHADG